MENLKGGNEYTDEHQLVKKQRQKTKEKPKTTAIKKRRKKTDIRKKKDLCLELYRSCKEMHTHIPWKVDNEIYTFTYIASD